MGNKINIYFILAVTGIFLLISCKSPIDIDSPNDNEPIISYRINPNLPENIFHENNEQIYLTANFTNAQIDTMSEIPYVWMDLTFDAAQHTFSGQDSCYITQFTIKIDSLPIIPFVEDTLGNSETGSWSYFIIGNNGLYADTLYTGMNNNLTRISFNFDKSRRELKAFINSNLIKSRDAEVSYFRATLTFKY